MQEEKQISPTGPSDRIRRVLEEVEKLDAEATQAPWAYYWREENGEAECGVTHERRPGHVYAVARCPRYVRKEQWEQDGHMISASRTLLPRLAKALEHALGVMATASDPREASAACYQIADILEGK